MLTNIIKQGVTYSWLATIADYPYPASAGWSLRLVLNPRAGGSVITINSTASGDDHLIQLAASTTATYAAGEYGYEIYAIKAAEQYDLESGQLTIRPGLLVAAAGTDTRSAAEVGLDNVRAMIRGTATQGVKRYSIGGRELERYTIAELIQLESKLSNDVRGEQAAAAMAAGRPNPRKVHVRMGRA